MRWILVTFLVLRSLMPLGIGGGSVELGPVGQIDACAVESGGDAADEACGCCCGPSACGCEMSPAPGVPDREPAPARPSDSGSNRPIVLGIEPTTEMVVGWVDALPAVSAALDGAPVHVLLGKSVQAAHCVWRT